VIAVRPGVLLDDRSDDGVEDAQGGGRSAGARAILEPFEDVSAATLLEAVDPVVQGLAADAEVIGKLLGRVAIGEPEEGLGTAALTAGRGMAEDVLQ
jgi:hypothetical protein